MLLVSEKEIGGDHAFFRDNKGSIWNKMSCIALYFTVFFELLLLNNYIHEKCMFTPNFLFGFQKPVLKAAQCDW